MLRMCLLPGMVLAASPQSLKQELENAVLPLLHSMSAASNASAWSFAYKDADVALQLCVGRIQRDSAARDCTPNDTFAWGSTTKPITSAMLLQLAEHRLLDLDAPVAQNGLPCTLS